MYYINCFNLIDGNLLGRNYSFLLISLLFSINQPNVYPESQKDFRTKNPAFCLATFFCFGWKWLDHFSLFDSRRVITICHLEGRYSRGGDYIFWLGRRNTEFKCWRFTPLNSLSFKQILKIKFRAGNL